MQPAIRDLVELCRYAAQHPRLVQGGGGNCSVKFNGHMAVKASGYFLEDVREDQGITVVSAVTGEPDGATQPRPSLEANLHLLLGPYVIHTHPIAVAALVCAQQGAKKFRTLFPGAHVHWVPYASPGERLAHQVAATLPGGLNLKKETHILFLANHGLFVSAPTAEDCCTTHEAVVRQMEDFFAKKQAVHAGKILPTAHYLSPDHAVYTQKPAGQPSERQAIAGREMRQWAEEVFKLVNSKGWDPIWLPEDEVTFLLNMQEEQYRQKLWEKRS